MSTSDVRNIESLQRMRSGLLSLADNWEKTLQEVRISLHRASQYFGDEVPRYWRSETEKAEQELGEAKDNLHQKQAAARAGDRVSAMEAQKRVERAKKRVDLCHQRVQAARSIAIEVRHQCDEMLGPLADLTDHSENQFPAAAAELSRLLDSLYRYADSSGLTGAPDLPSGSPPKPDPGPGPDQAGR